MKKSLPLIIVLAVIVVGLTTWNFLGRNKQALIENGVQQTETTQEEAKGESFTGKIKDAFMKNIPLKCTYKVDENNILHRKIDIHYKDAIEGNKIDYNHIDGKTYRIDLNPRTKDKDIIKLPGKGLKDGRSRKDLHLHLNIIVDYSRL